MDPANSPLETSRPADPSGPCQGRCHSLSTRPPPSSVPARTVALGVSMRPLAQSAVGSGRWESLNPPPPWPRCGRACAREWTVRPYTVRPPRVGGISVPRPQGASHVTSFVSSFSAPSSIPNASADNSSPTPSRIFPISASPFQIERRPNRVRRLEGSPDKIASRLPSEAEFRALLDDCASPLVPSPLSLSAVNILPSTI